MFVIISHDVRGTFKKERGGGTRLNGSNALFLYGSYYILWIYDL